EEFLTFSWPTITITDAWTGKPHIVTRLTSIGAFLKMIKTRFGETLPQASNIVQITPFETSPRHLRHISDYASYKRLYSTLPAVLLSALKARIKTGEPKAIRELWEKKDRTFLAIDFEWSERNESSCLEWGYAAVRCGHLDDLGHWPPDPSTNYRAGHVIVSEYVDKVVNKHFPTYPWQYAFGESQVVSKTRLPEIIQAIISSLAAPDSETTPNTLVLVAHGIAGDLARLDEMKIRLPHNLLAIDTAIFERALHSSGARGLMLDPRTNQPRVQGSTLSLENVVRSLGNTPQGEVSMTSPLPGVTMHNAGNDAYLALYVLQALLDPGTKAPVPKVKKPGLGSAAGAGSAAGLGRGAGAGAGRRPNSMAGLTTPAPIVVPMPMPMPIPRPLSMVLGTVFEAPSTPVSGAAPSPRTPVMGGYDLAEEFGAMKIEKVTGEKTGEKREKERDREKEKEKGSRGRRVPGKAGAGGSPVGVGSGNGRGGWGG
ncbi:hypothetical protein E4T56_gene13989, partial [Termitomyces sp. T112]